MVNGDPSGDGIIIGELVFPQGRDPPGSFLDQIQFQKEQLLLRPPLLPLLSPLLAAWTSRHFHFRRPLSSPSPPSPRTLLTKLLLVGCFFLHFFSFCVPFSFSYLFFFFFLYTFVIPADFCLLRLLGQTFASDRNPLVSERLIPLVALGPHSIQPLPLPLYYLSSSLLSTLVAFANWLSFDILPCPVSWPVH